MFEGNFIMNLNELISKNCKKPICDCSDEELYHALIKTVGELAKHSDKPKSKKKLYYICAEFLLGKLLGSNLLNLGIYDEVKSILAQNGKDLIKIEEVENEPSLGNGGLGRLAACFLDSVAALGLNGDGIGLNYHYGLFRQVFEDNLQTEKPNEWIEKNGFLKKTDTSYEVKFKNLTVKSRLYDMDIIGSPDATNTLHLFDIETVDESIVEDGIDFDKTDIKKNLTLFLYPDDSDEDGKRLRVYQQYFMISNAAQYILDECEKKGSTLYDLYDYAIIQINDTHPTLIIPELIRLLTLRDIPINDAIKIVSKTCAYTNHTILAEALEKWPMGYLEKIVPNLVPIIEILDNKVRRKFDDESVYIIDKDERVHMAHIDIHCGFSINGVAALHTDILKHSELNNFYKIYPDKFNNKTNGITFRRWLLHCNPHLSSLITELIGDGFKTNSIELSKLKKFENDKEVLNRLIDIKQKNKVSLKEFILNTQGIDLLENSIFDMQIKRLHEYKRQQMNALYLINKYLEIKSGKIPKRPITAIFGAKAAPAYTIAKDIIHLILCLQQLIENDLEVSPHLKIVMVENYNVTYAQKLIPACDISEQISLASKEASGTSNMKFILNGAVILGTEDGANVEIHNLVGDDNIYIFGDESKTVIERYKNGSYKAQEYYEKDSTIKQAVDFIIDDSITRLGNKENLQRLRNELINKDWFMTFPDFKDYSLTRDKAFSDFEKREEWAKKMLINISCAGDFSSDETIKRYNKDIWKL